MRCKLIAGLALLTAPAFAQDITLEPRTFTVSGFELASGERVDEMVAQYATLGEPARDADGTITNAVLFAHGWSGDYTQSVTLAKDLFASGAPFDPDRWYLIFPTALGSPGSSAPSTSGLGPDFPSYTIADMVSVQHELVTEHLGVERLKGVAGISMGGHQTLQWITQYPDMMQWAVPIATGPATTGRNVGIWGLMSLAVESDPAYAGGRYEAQPRDGLKRAFMGTYLWYFATAWYQEEFATPDAVMKGLENAGLGSEKMDANDIIWRNHAMRSYDVRAQLPDVQADVLVVGVSSDELFPPAEELEPVAAAIPGAELFVYDSIFGHVGSALDIATAIPAIQTFLDEQE